MSQILRLANCGARLTINLTETAGHMSKARLGVFSCETCNALRSRTTNCMQKGFYLSVRQTNTMAKYDHLIRHGKKNVTKKSAAKSQDQIYKDHYTELLSTLQKYRNFKARKLKKLKHQAAATCDPGSPLKVSKLKEPGADSEGEFHTAAPNRKPNVTNGDHSNTYSSVASSTELQRTNASQESVRKFKSGILSEIFSIEPHIEHQATAKTVQASLMERVKDAESAEELVSELLELLEDDTVPVAISDNLHFCVEHLQRIAKKHEADRKDKLKSRQSLQIIDRDNLRKEDLELLTKKWAQVKKTIQVQMVKNEEDKKKIEFNSRCEAYIEVCIHTNMLEKAHSMLMSRHSRWLKSKEKPGKHPVLLPRNISNYNQMYKAWAKKKRIDKIQELFIVMNDAAVKPNVQSYLSCLECIGRNPVYTAGLTKQILREIQALGVTLDNLATECATTPVEWTYVERAVRAVKPDYKGFPRDAVTSYNCELVNPLNDTREVKNPFHGTFDAVGYDIGAAISEQLNVEKSDKIVIKSIEPVTVTPQMKKARIQLLAIQKEWQEAMKQGFIETKESIMLQKGTGYKDMDIIPYLELFTVDQYVDMMIEEMTKITSDMSEHSPVVSYLAQDLGQKIYNKYVTSMKQKSGYVDQVTAMHKEYCELYNAATLHKSHRDTWLQLAQSAGVGFSQSETKPWPASVMRDIGRLLYKVILTYAKVDANHYKSNQPREMTPGFYTVYRVRHFKVMVEEVMPHPVLVRLNEEAKSDQLTFSPMDMPLVVPPMPWTTAYCGGNLFSTTELIKHVHTMRQQAADLSSISNQQILPVLDAVNAVSASPWKINKPILDLIIELFNNGGDETLDVARNQSAFKDKMPKLSKDLSSADQIAVLRERNLVKKEQSETYSAWCTELYRLSIANKFRDRIFWFPHNLDFRGRAYAVSPYFNHLGSDISRSILMFAKGKPLGENGLDWLKIHLVNLTGFRKRSSNADRLAFANDTMSEILDSADHPFTGGKWWQTSEEQWQTLACCKEIAAAVRSPDPTCYISHLPVHQDGSCNGLQHYAALGRDKAGAESVNLHPFLQPKDVYQDVVDLVEAERVKDAEEGVEIAQVLNGFVRRKVIKQTIMTTVYGVTMFGARAQIEGQLNDIPEFPKEHVIRARNYLSDKTFYALRQMFTSTKEIQDWFVLCAEMISKLTLRPLSWTTPVGLPVVQPYYKEVKFKMPQSQFTNIVEISHPKKQMNSFPPNFIHSLDSTHMMLTAIYCLNAGINFVSVHDCFWTHAPDIPVMNQICREQFVALHNQPILEDLSGQLFKKYGFHVIGEEDTANIKEVKEVYNHTLRRVPNTGEFDLEKVLQSTYFFS